MRTLLERRAHDPAREAVPTDENLMVARHTLAVVLAGESEGATAR